MPKEDPIQKAWALWVQREYLNAEDILLARRAFFAGWQECAKTQPAT